MAKKEVKMQRDLNFEEGTVTLTIKDGSGPMVFNIADLPPESANKLPLFGLNHKLGDATSGKLDTPSEAEESIQKVWEGLKEGKWVVKTPAGPKVSIKAMANQLKALSGKERAAAEKMFASLGIMEKVNAALAEDEAA